MSNDDWMRVLLYKCSECEQISSDPAWDRAYSDECHKRRFQIKSGEVSEAEAIDRAWLPIAPMQTRFTHNYGLDDTMICPRCGYFHRDDENSSVDEIQGVALTIEAHKRLREIEQAARVVCIQAAEGIARGPLPETWVDAMTALRAALGD